MWTRFMNQTLVHKQIKLLLKKTLELDQILDDHRLVDGYYKLPEAVHEQFVSACFALGQLHKQVSEHYAAENIKIFNITAKTHCLMHIALLSKFFHPGLAWCFQGEDFMRVVQRLLQSCVRGNSTYQAMIKSTHHYNLAMQLRYEKECGL